MLPIAQLNCSPRALFSDLDGTMTTAGVVEPATYAALAEVGATGMPVVIVTGRPAGWGQAIMSFAPVAAVVTENGGVTFIRRSRTLDKVYGVPAASIPEWRRRMHATAVDVMNETGLRMSSDSRYREVDLALDWNEEVSLPEDHAEQAVTLLRRAGFAAVRSSVHVNFGPPAFDKLTACRRVITDVLGGDLNDLSGYVFIGDALNDAPMFAAFDHSVGVANIRHWMDELSAHPKFITPSPEGAGLRELVARLLELRA